MDPPRLLARRSELAYTRSPVAALTGEPEAPTQDEQAELTRLAHQRNSDRCRTELERALDRVRKNADYHAAQLRHAERQRQRLERQLPA